MASAPVGVDGDVAVDEGELRDTIFSYLGPAVVLAELGRLVEAAEMYRLAGPPQRWDPPPYFRVTAWANAVLVAVAIDRRAELEFLRDRLEAERGRSSVTGAGTAAYGGTIELYLGKALMALGDLDAAAEDFEHARSHDAAVGAVGFQAEASIELAAALLRRARDGDLDRANVVLAEGEAIASRCGMTPWVARAASLRAALGDRPAGPLSRREAEVAELVGQGMTNRQIASELYISERTAQTHVQHILTKLGFSTRSQIAAWITAQREPTS
jgi:DNA-binding CsgD family transcriptional regulator